MCDWLQTVFRPVWLPRTTTSTTTSEAIKRIVEIVVRFVFTHRLSLSSTVSTPSPNPIATVSFFAIRKRNSFWFYYDIHFAARSIHFICINLYRWDHKNVLLVTFHHRNATLLLLLLQSSPVRRRHCVHCIMIIIIYFSLHQKLPFLCWRRSNDIGADVC